ncbi:MAG: ribosome-binding factor A, partial [Streptosporangiaceae bacterium]
MNQVRARKLGDRIVEIVAEMLERRVKDPRLGFVTVTEARVTGDLRDATVFYTVYG